LIINYFFSKKNKSSKNISSPFFLTTRTSVFSSSFLFFLPLSLLLGCWCWCFFLKPDREREKVCLQQPARARFSLFSFSPQNERISFLVRYC